VHRKNNVDILRSKWFIEVCVHAKTSLTLYMQRSLTFHYSDNTQLYIIILYRNSLQIRTPRSDKKYHIGHVLKHGLISFGLISFGLVWSSLYFSLFHYFFFSSPEPKAQVSYCHRNLSGVRLSVCLSVRPSVCPSVSFFL